MLKRLRRIVLDYHVDFENNDFKTQLNIEMLNLFKLKLTKI